MLPTLEDGDYVLVLKAQDVKRGDVVLVQLSNGQYITKRVVGIEGDDILIKAHELYVNGILFDNLTNSLQGDYQENIHVPSESFYILGDNRLESFDSRSIGYISKTMVKGVVSVQGLRWFEAFQEQQAMGTWIAEFIINICISPRRLSAGKKRNPAFWDTLPPYAEKNAQKYT